MALLRLYSYAPTRTTLTILNNSTATGYAVPVGGLDFGNAAWEHSFSGPRGTQGARPSIGVPQNRVATFPIRIVGQTSKDAMLTKIAAAVEIVDEMRRYGGRILFQSASATNRIWFDVMTCGWAYTKWDQATETNFVEENLLTAVCAPYLSGDPMDTLDTFDADTTADYTASTGNSGSISVSGGVLIPSSTALKVYRHTAKAYAVSDVRVMLKIQAAATVTNGVWGVMARADVGGADTAIVAEIVQASSVLRIAKYVGGSLTSLATSAFTAGANTTWWLALRCEGNLLVADVFTSATFRNTPSIVDTPTQTVSYTLTPAEASRFLTGHTGFRITPASTSETYDDFLSEPYTYKLVNAPERILLGGQVPGDVPAVCDLTVTPVGGAATPVWGMAAWLERPLVTNLCWNGDFESATVGSSGWTNAAVAGVIGAATSVARDTSSARNKYGLANLSIVTPATTDTGGSFLINRRFKKGRIYAALVWASSAAATTSVRVKLGVSGDLGTGTAAALVAAAIPVVYAVTWQPTADRDSAYVAFGVNAATATTMSIDGVVVVEVPSIALSAAIASAGATTMTPYSTPSDIPNLQPDGSLSTPFLALIDTEIVQVTAVGATWTIARGVERSVAATHAQDALVIILPPLRPQLEGKGAQPPFGVIESDSYVPSLSSSGAGTFAANTADANARGGTVLRWTPGTSGAQLATIVYFIDPNTLYPDDYTQGELDVEVWLRELWTTSLTNMRVTLSAQPEGGSTMGPERFTREYGAVGKLLQVATAKVGRQHRLGTLPLVVDAANPQRWRLKLALACTGGAAPTWDIDHLTLAATRSRVAWPTGKVNDTANAAGAYPSFVPYDASWGASSAMSKILRSDGSSLVASPGQLAYPDNGMGRPIELPDLDSDLLIKLSTRVPDDPTSDSTDEAAASITTSAHAAVTPRYVLGRAV